MEKICSKCKINKHYSEYVKNKACIGGVKSSCKSCDKEWRINNRELIRLIEVEYTNRNRDKVRLKWRNISKNNRDSINEKRRIKYKNNNLFKLSMNIRNSINKYIKNKEISNQEILGCSFEEFKIYLESKFEPWMNWENKGRYNGELNYGWDIDHIKPLSKARNNEELIILNHYSNLQPLCGFVNRHIKSDNY